MVAFQFWNATFFFDLLHWIFHAAKHKMVIIYNLAEYHFKKGVRRLKIGWNWAQNAPLCVCYIIYMKKSKFFYKKSAKHLDKQSSLCYNKPNRMRYYFTMVFYQKIIRELKMKREENYLWTNFIETHGKLLCVSCWSSCFCLSWIW